MALSELPVNNMRNSLALGLSRPIGDLQSHAVSKVSEKIRGLPRDPSTIQSMLKNSTETGNVGHFSRRPSRLPQSTPRAIPAKNLASQQDSNRRPSSRPRHIDTQHSLSVSHPGNSMSSTAVSVHASLSQRSYRVSSRGPISEDERSYSMAQSSHTNRSIPSPRLHSSPRFQGQGDMQGIRPRSPYAYPTRLKRPGYRPSSPAYSDFNRPFAPMHPGFYPEASFRTQSPMSMTTLQRAPSVFQHDFGQSDSTLSYRSSSPGQEPYRTGPFSPSSTRVPTPGLPMGLHHVASRSREPSLLNSTHSGWDSQRSASPLPVFYDYTEAFEENNHSDILTQPVTEQAIPQDNGNVYHELEKRTSSGKSHEIIEVESPAESSQEASGDEEKGPQSSSDRSGGTLRMPRRSELGNVACSAASSVEEQEMTVLAGQDQGDNNCGLPSPKSVNNDGMTNLQSSSASTFHTSQLELPTSNTPASSVEPCPHSISSSESMYSVQSSTRHENPGFSPETVDTAKSSTFQVQPARSSTSVPNDPNTPTDPLPPSEVAFSESSFGRWSDSEPSQIFAPTPERLISSANHRHRFSRILSIGEGLIGGSESNIILERGAIDETITVHKEEINVHAGDSELTPVSKPDQTSVGQEKKHAAGEKLVGPSLSDAPVGSGGSPGSLGNLKLTESNDNPSGSPRIQPLECHPGASMPLPALKPAVEEYSIVTKEAIGNTNRKARTSEHESTMHSPESRLLPEEKNDSAIHGIPVLRSYSTPADTESASPPYSFTAILAGREDNTPRDEVEALGPQQKEKIDITHKSSQPRLNLKKRIAKASIDSLPDSRPWNLSTSYPWTDEDPQFEVTMPDASKDSQLDDVKLPRFKLRIHRASSSIGGPVKLVKQAPPPLELSAPRKTSLSSDLFRSSTFNSKPRPSITITQNNSSHTGPIATRFAGNITSPLRTSIASPCISLVPPSPGLNLEVRSFFSDDSSQVQPKGSLRKRISQLRAMATRGNSSDDVKGVERGLLSSAMGRSRTSKRSIKQECIPSEGLYNLKHIRWRLEEKVKVWLHRSKDTVRSWGGKMRLSAPKTRPGTGVYTGI